MSELIDAELEKRAKTKMEIDPDLTLEKAKVEVLLENPELYKIYKGEEKAVKKSSVLAELDKKAKNIQKNNPEITRAQAVKKVLEINPEIYREYTKNRG